MATAVDRTAADAFRRSVRWCAITVHGAETAVPVGCVAIERPETDGRQAIGLSEVTQRIHIGHGEDLVLGVVPEMVYPRAPSELQKWPRYIPSDWRRRASQSWPLPAQT